jgi:hypothetical protein
VSSVLSLPEDTERVGAIFQKNYVVLVTELLDSVHISHLASHVRDHAVLAVRVGLDLLFQIHNNTNTNRNSSQPSASATSTPAANQFRNPARRKQGRCQGRNQEQETTTTTPVQDVLPPLLNRDSFGSRRVHEQCVADKLRNAQNKKTLKLQRKIISSDIRRSCQQWYQNTRNSNIKLQAWGRQLLVKAKYHETLQTRIAQNKRFQSLWKQVIVQVQVVSLANNNPNAASNEQVELSWEDIKAKRFDMMQSLEETDAGGRNG